jgi:hypothetical protein
VKRLKHLKQVKRLKRLKHDILLKPQTLSHVSRPRMRQPETKMGVFGIFSLFEPFSPIFVQSATLAN